MKTKSVYTLAVLAAMGSPGKALREFDRAEKDGYNLYNLPFQRGLALMAMGRVAEAHRQFEATRDMNPPSPTKELLLLHLVLQPFPLPQIKIQSSGV